jgi:hypothetical protein
MRDWLATEHWPKNRYLIPVNANGLRLLIAFKFLTGFREDGGV